MQVSTIICTKNRQAALANALTSLQQAILPVHVHHEIIVSDNGCDRAVAAMVAEQPTQQHLSYRYVAVTKPGVSHARNAGISIAAGDIIAFVDDDCRVSPDWLVVLCNDFQLQPDLAVMGGRVELWDKCDARLAVRDSREPAILESPAQLFRFIIGCNLAFRRRTLDITGVFDTALGTGTRTRSGADIDLIYRTHQQGLRAQYNPDLLVYHSHGRRNKTETENVKQGYFVGRGAFYAKHMLLMDGAIARLAVKELQRKVQRMLRRRFSSETGTEFTYFRLLLQGMLIYVLTRLGSGLRIIGANR